MVGSGNCRSGRRALGGAKGERLSSVGGGDEHRPVGKMAWSSPRYYRAETTVQIESIGNTFQEILLQLDFGCAAPSSTEALPEHLQL